MWCKCMANYLSISSASSKFRLIYEPNIEYLPQPINDWRKVMWVSSIMSQQLLLTSSWPLYPRCLRLEQATKDSGLLDLVNCDFYLWGNLNRKMYKNNSFIIEELQYRQTHAVTSVPKDELQKVIELIYMLWACLKSGLLLAVLTLVKYSFFFALLH